MTNPTDHKITAEIGEGLKVDIVYRYTPITDFPEALPELELLSGTVLGHDGDYNELAPEYVRELADNWLQDEGYDRAVDHAEDERHGNEE